MYTSSQPQAANTNFSHFMGNNTQGAQGQPKAGSTLPAGYQPVTHGPPISPGVHQPATGHDAGKHGEGHGHGHDEHGYNPLAMPPDWEIAKLHARCRRTAPDFPAEKKPAHVTACPCCAFELERDDIPFCSDPMALSYLGSGFTLYYNFMKYCIIILFIQLCVQQGYNLYTNYTGDYCSIIETKTIEHHKVSEPHCPNSIFLKLSLANKLNSKEQIKNTYILNFASIFIIMGVLLYFRKSQRKIDTEIDVSMLTPSDYTIVVKNIPIGLKVDYHAELKNLFETVAVNDSATPIVVRKVVLVYDIEEIIQLEKKLDKLVEKKKEAIKEADYDFKHRTVELVDEEIEHVEHQIHAIEEDYLKNNTKFVGIAFVSFDLESMKNKVLAENQHTLTERIETYFNKGITPDLSDDKLSWHSHQIFIEVAPEPNDVDWEFVHIATKNKLISRIRAWVFYILFEGSAFLVIYYISLQLAKKVDLMHEEELKGEANEHEIKQVNLFSSLISFSIVLFNKFIVAKVIHYIVDDELISNKTSFQIKFAHKYAVALFTNAAIISYMVDIVILKNIVGYAGFIENESQIFILNALFPPLVWCIDPWSLCKNVWRRYILSKGNKSLLTQQEANILMEEPDYLAGKRYSDVMKTMWFTFLYGTAIPLGTLFSAIGILIYYFVDYYNILRRRTVKESISIQLSNEMIEMLELIIIFSAFGNMTMSYSFFKEISIYDIILMVIAILYMLAPMDEVSEWLFPVVNNEEDKPYSVGCKEFDTDYDRENPVTKAQAIRQWNNFLKSQDITGVKHVAPAGEFGFKNNERFLPR